jgi:uncharacterized repeat protein (TIGR01451 family)
MKHLLIAGMGAIALFGTVPFVSHIWVSAIAQNVQPRGQIQLRLEVEKQVQDQQGKQNQKWEPLKGQAVVQPGDVLRYTLSGENKSDRPIKNLTLNQPIPQGMVYMLKSANVTDSGKITYSIDGGRNFGENPTIKVTLPDGKVETQPAPAKAYTHLRLQLPLVTAKSTVKVTYQLQVR